jgi:hypothetical protein
MKDNNMYDMKYLPRVALVYRAPASILISLEYRRRIKHPGLVYYSGHIVHPQDFSYLLSIAGA